MIGHEPDPVRPDVPEMQLARRGSRPNEPPWVEFPSLSGCTVVNGPVHIIAKVLDSDDAGSALDGAQSLGIDDLKWRACTSGNPDCEWIDTHKYDVMPQEWTNPLDDSYAERFSFNLPWPTIREEWSDVPPNWPGPLPGCPIEPQTYMILTKSSGWDTAEIVNGDRRYPDGTYKFIVKAIDYVGNEGKRELDVCVRNWDRAHQST